MGRGSRDSDRVLSSLPEKTCLSGASWRIPHHRIPSLLPTRAARVLETQDTGLREASACLGAQSPRVAPASPRSLGGPVRK